MAWKRLWMISQIQLAFNLDIIMNGIWTVQTFPQIFLMHSGWKKKPSIFGPSRPLYFRTRQLFNCSIGVSWKGYKVYCAHADTVYKRVDSVRQDWLFSPPFPSPGKHLFCNDDIFYRVMKNNLHFGQNMRVRHTGKTGEVPLDILFVSSSSSAWYLSDCQEQLTSVLV